MLASFKVFHKKRAKPLHVPTVPGCRRETRRQPGEKSRIKAGCPRQSLIPQYVVLALPLLLLNIQRNWPYFTAAQTSRGASESRSSAAWLQDEKWQQADKYWLAKTFCATRATVEVLCVNNKLIVGGWLWRERGGGRGEKTKPIRKKNNNSKERIKSTTLSLCSSFRVFVGSEPGLVLPGTRSE